MHCRFPPNRLNRLEKNKVFFSKNFSNLEVICNTLSSSLVDKYLSFFHVIVAFKHISLPLREEKSLFRRSLSYNSHKMRINLLITLWVEFSGRVRNERYC